MMLLGVVMLSAFCACASPGSVSGGPRVCGQHCGSETGGGNGTVSVSDGEQQCEN